MTAVAQTTNPQTSFAAQMSAYSPSAWYSFNDFTTSFLDNVTRVNATGGTAAYAVPYPLPVTYTGSASTGQAQVNATPLPAGPLSEVALQFPAAPTAGQTVYVILYNQSGTSLTVSSSFALTVAAVTTPQVFVAGTNYTPVTVTAGQLMGVWTGSGHGVGYSGSAPLTGGSSYYLTTASVPTGTATYTATTVSYGFAAYIGATATSLSVRQQGFDTTTPNNTSVGFPWNGYSVAPNNTLGAIDWNSPWSLYVHIDRLNWTRSGTLVLASKGDLNNSNGNWWKLYVTMTGGYSQLCFTRNGFGNASVNSSYCTVAGQEALLNGFGFDILVEDNGTGQTGYVNGASALSMYLNALPIVGSLKFASGSSSGFGSVNSITISGSGTGYAASTAFTASGGGANCVVNGTMTSSGGVPVSVSVSSSYGCTSLPTLVFTSPTGTGATLTGVLNTASMNATTTPLIAPGYLAGGLNYGVGGANSLQNPVYVDEVAVFPGNVNPTAIFYQTKFYQQMLPARNPVGPAPTAVILDNYGCGTDISGDFALALAVAAHLNGLVKLEGVVDNDYGATGRNSIAYYRQVLDQAGLAQIPVTVGTGSYALTTNTNCPPSTLNTYNASTPQSYTAYGDASVMYRTILAANPTTPVVLWMMGPANGISEFMQSPADSISPLTGAQLLAQNQANGGNITAQGLGPSSACTGGLGPSACDNTLIVPSAGQYVVSHNGATPIIWYGGIGANTGPGVLQSRTANDPLYMAAALNGSDGRSSFNQLQIVDLISPYFTGGVTIAISGSGTGYANQTYFTSTGGGPNCNVQGIMVSSGGVPSSITYTWGGAVAAYVGIGYGCTSAPTIVLTAPAGTGAVLTATPTTVCGTTTVTLPYTVNTSTSTCSNHYYSYLSIFAAPMPLGNLMDPLLTWFENSLIDPPPNGAPRVQ
jgi:hypothetical protein